MVNAVKVFKKASPNGKVTAYLSQRDFVENTDHTSPIDGAVVVDGEFLQERKVYVRVAVTYRYGREEDEVMGLQFSKEFELVKKEVVPKGNEEQVAESVNRLLQKLEGDARPFSVQPPETAPPSVTLEPGAGGTNKTLGVTYELTVYVAENEEEPMQKQSSVSFAVRKIQFAPDKSNYRHPQILVRRTFTLSPGKLCLEVYLDQDMFFHGQTLEPHINVTNSSKKTVKYILAQVVQHVEVTMTSSYFSRIVASIESREGCPIIPNTTFSRTMGVTPTAFRAFGVALDGQVQDKDAHLASSTLVSAERNINDALGILVSYSLRVKLNCGAIGGELTADLPFKLMHPRPSENKATLQRTQSVNENIVIEEFSVLRRGASISDEIHDQ
ncbi:arrestin homolog [Panulirus ornatus]|uniref:arrestin homolog n=1 Tax=Panulirus ornatus TaxID=150431 RepID=UPI003A84C6DC